MNSFYYNEKQEIFLHKKTLFSAQSNFFFPQKRNNKTKGQIVIFIYKKQGKTKRKCSEGKNLVIYLKID